MKKFDDATHLELMMSKSSKLVGYLEIYGHKEWLKEVNTVWYEGRDVMPVYYYDDEITTVPISFWDPDLIDVSVPKGSTSMHLFEFRQDGYQTRDEAFFDKWGTRLDKNIYDRSTLRMRTKHLWAKFRRSISKLT